MEHAQGGHRDDCEACGGTGTKNYFFKSSSYGIKTVRNVQLYCHVCFPNAEGVASKKADEVEIDSEEAYRLLYEEGWREYSE